MNFLFKKDYIQNQLFDFSAPERLVMRHKSFINSAVILLIIPYKNKPYDLVLIRRTKQKNDKHSGEMSFPGGKFDPLLDKSYLDTALRELEEELGIPKQNVEILGCIDDHLTPKGFIITAFVAIINENQKLTKQEEEVKEIVKIPVTFFANKRNFKERTYKLKNELIGVGKFKYKTQNNVYVVFGATSHIIVNYLDKVYNLGLITPGCRRIRCEDIKDRIIQ
ncbi:MAG: CoA pyrophosphatase [Promethearchaeota archaeon]|nr:MAG: CoA pyrophosphatase [Candidatus Lokiarchaeota archaeon]